MIKIKHLTTIIIICSFMPLLQACFSGHVLSSMNLNRDDYGLRESSYAAADMLSQYADVHIGKYKPIAIETIAMKGREDIEVPIGALIADQVSIRLSQLGYNVINRPNPKIIVKEPEVKESKKSEEKKGLLAKLGLSDFIVEEEEKPVSMAYITKVEKGIVLTGIYNTTRTKLIVSLKIINKDNNKIIAAYEYILPLSRDMRELAKIPWEKKGFLHPF